MPPCPPVSPTPAVMVASRLESAAALEVGGEDLSDSPASSMVQTASLCMSMWRMCRL